MHGYLEVQVGSRGYLEVQEASSTWVQRFAGWLSHENLRMRGISIQNPHQK